MAYTPQQFDPRRLEELQSRVKDANEALSASPTAYAPGSTPSVQDLANEANSKALGQEIEILKGKELSEKWYGKGREEETFKGEGTQQSALMKGLNSLSVPLYATAGAVEGALGLGSKKGVLDNITANVKEREGFGNILRRSGMPHLASLPIGFALDVAFDPLNWATAGTAALIPRVATGLVKGGVKGAATGAVSRLAPMGLKTANILSVGGITRAQNTAAGLARNSGLTPSKFAKFSALVGNTSKKIADAGGEAATQYDELIGRQIATSKSGVRYGKDLLREKGPGYYFGESKFTPGETFESLIGDILPGRMGEDFIRTFKYSPANWLRLKRIESKMIENADEIKKTTGFEFIPKTSETRWATEADIPEDIKAGIAKQLDTPPGTVDTPDTTGIFDEASPTSGSAARVFNDGIDIAENVPTAAQAEGSAEIIRRLGGEAMNDVTAEDMIKIAQRWEDAKLQNVTGVKWYDDANNYLRTNFKVKNTQVVAKIMDAYSAYISAFKLAKIALTPAAHMNAILGNTTANAMMGIDITNPKLISSISGIAKASLSKGPAAENQIRKMFKAEHWVDYAGKDKLGFGGSYGFSLDELARQDEIAESAILKLIKDSGKKGGLGEDVASKLKEESDSRKLVADQIKKATPPVQGHVEQISYALNEIKDSKNAFNELGNSVSRKVREEAARVKRIAAKEALPGDDIKIAGFGTKAMDVLMNKSMDAFGGIDPVFRIGTALHLTENGITESEIRTISKMVGMTKDDILDVVKDEVTGEKLFKLTPAKATEVVGETFLNYSAMPAAVKMLRTLPILGAPFASFTYGMTARTAKTALYNPAIFNKTNFLLQELSGDKGPLEKKAMEGKYYSWFNDPGMVKIPFVQKFPLYVNMTNMIPYYSMNMFTPSERKYRETLPDSVLSFLDKFPILQDPAGQVLFDYMIQPMLINAGQTPQGAFGQALYPADATGLEKFGYGMRQLGESVTPGISGLAAVLTSSLPDEHINYVPSYRYRQLANALRGKSVLGIPSKESASSRTARTLGSMFGVPTHRMDTTFTEGEVKKQIKNAQ